MSSLLGHLMQHVIVTPIPKEIDLDQTLWELCFEETIDMFGIFYMDISLINLTCDEIPREDSRYLAQLFKIPFAKHSVKKKKKAPHLHSSQVRFLNNIPGVILLGTPRPLGHLSITIP